MAVDNLLERLARIKGLRLVRLGHPARMYPHLQRHSLDAQISFSEQTKIVQDVRRDIDKAVGQLKGRGGKGGGAARELKELRKELREREQEATASILRNADVVLATLTSASPDGPLRHLRDKQHFDITVIDECSQVSFALIRLLCKDLFYFLFF